MAIELSSGTILNDRAIRDLTEQTALTPDQLRWGIEMGLADRAISQEWLAWAAYYLNGATYDGKTTRAYIQYSGSDDGDPLLDLDETLLHLGAGDIESEAEFREMMRDSHGH